MKENVERVFYDDDDNEGAGKWYQIKMALAIKFDRQNSVVAELVVQAQLSSYFWFGKLTHDLQRFPLVNFHQILLVGMKVPMKIRKQTN